MSTSTGEPIFDHVKEITESAKRLNVALFEALLVDRGSCAPSKARALTAGSSVWCLADDPPQPESDDTAPIPKQPEGLRPNVPPRMM